MREKYSDTIKEEYVIEEDKFRGLSAIRQESELFDEEENIEHKLINIKYIELPKGEDWEILENKIPVLILKGVRFTKKERAFFKTPDGMKFLINGYKKGWKKIVDYKRNLKKCL